VSGGRSWCLWRVVVVSQRDLVVAGKIQADEGLRLVAGTLQFLSGIRLAAVQAILASSQQRPVLGICIRFRVFFFFGFQTGSVPFSFRSMLFRLV
jgi:hypothetical protein